MENQIVARDGKSGIIMPVSLNQGRDVWPLWQGFYAGGSLGYGTGKSTQMYDRNANHGLASVNPDGFVFSATGGYNY
ncbi:MAG TPA: hypothetical protein ENJ99_01545, partial [Rhizobiales bacterium]|nr:hypothetical protein [Hyphomicrobiales bacterium]